MYCDKHVNTELMMKNLGTDLKDGKVYFSHVLYCPHCKQDKYKQLSNDGEVIITKI